METRWEAEKKGLRDVMHAADWKFESPGHDRRSRHAHQSLGLPPAKSGLMQKV
jgi:hypothetical protein